MARYKHTDADYGQGLFLTVKLEDQLILGTFEYMLNDIIGAASLAAFPEYSKKQWKYVIL